MIRFSKYTSFLLFILSFFLLIRCSTQRNNLVNRNLHQLSTRYNTVFNGEEALNKEVKQIEENFHDNFFELLPVEKFDGTYKISKTGENEKNANLDRAEEKAVKAIQKHSMEIYGEQVNNQIDRAYMLLGKSRYYQKRYLAALDAFNYEIDTDFKSNLRPEFRLWKAKTNIQMDNFEQAIRSLRYVANYEKSPQKVKAEAYAFAGEALVKIDSLPQAVKSFEQAAQQSKNKTQKARYLFITAQLLDKMHLRDSAITFLQQIEEMKRPREFRLQAELYRYHLSLDSLEQHPQMLEALNKKLKRYEYHLYYPYINYEIGEIYHVEDSLQTAVDYYTQATRSQDKHLKEKAYEQMSNIGFQKKDYIMAGAYLDSLLQVMPQETLKYLKTKHKRNNIEDVIVLEKTIKRNDSLMRLVNSDSLGRVKLIEAYIEQLKEKEVAETNQTENEDPFAIKPKYTSFYFYNQGLVEKGKAYFEKTWGKLSLTDLWRLKNKMSMEDDEFEETDEVETTDNETGNENEEQTIPEKYQVGYYYKQIPTDPKQIDSILGDLNYAHYQVGMIYYEKFKELEKAKENLETMLASNPKKELIPPAKYNLYKVYKDLGNTLMAEHLSQEIVNQYPESIYAELIQNPDKVFERSNKAFQEAYQQLFDLYKDQKYEELLATSEPLLLKFSFHPELGKIDLLRAMAIARSQGLEAYEQALKEIILKYPKSVYQEEAEKRMKLVNQYKNSSYTSTKTQNYKLLIPYDIQDSSVNKVIDCLKKIIKKEDSEYLHISKDYFTPEQSFIVVHNFLSDTSAHYFADLFKKSACTPENYFVISSDNYKILQLTKKLEAYKTFAENEGRLKIEDFIKDEKNEDDKEIKDKEDTQQTQ